MKVGKLVKKVAGRDKGKSGMVLEVFNEGGPGHEVMSVLVEGKVTNWPSHLTEVDHDKDCDCGKH